MIDVTPAQLAMVQKTLAEQVPDADTLAFGSRVRGTAKPYSDLDLAVRGPRKLTLREVAALKEAFEESELPFRVDFVDWHAISAEFRRVIEGGCERLGPVPAKTHATSHEQSR